MPLKLLPAEHADMHELVNVIYAACADPRDPFLDLCLPGLGDWSDATLEEGISQITKKYLSEWRASDTQAWWKVVDEETGEIISVSKWEIYKRNPYEDGIPHIDADWLQEGSRLREYMEWLINTRYRKAAERCQCPHIWLDICATAPSGRKRGAGSMALRWGNEMADKMDVEAFIEATLEGARLYERFGFETKEIVDLRKDDAEVDEEWRGLAENCPLIYRWMKREKKSRR